MENLLPQFVGSIVNYLLSTTLGGRTDKVVASHADNAGSSPVKAEPIYMYRAQVALSGYCSVKGGGNGQLFGSTVSDAIVRS